MTGDDKVVCLHERVFLGRYRQTVLCEGEGPITCIRWRGRFAAWVSRKVRSSTPSNLDIHMVEEKLYVMSLDCIDLFSARAFGSTT